MVDSIEDFGQVNKDAVSVKVVLFSCLKDFFQEEGAMLATYFGCAPDLKFRASFFRNSCKRAEMVRLMIFEPKSRRLIPLRLFGWWISPFLGSMQRWPMCQSLISWPGSLKNFAQRV